MNDDAQLIKAALDRRFARAATPPCPDGAWHATATAPATAARPRRFSRGFAYAAALVGVVAIGGLAAQAASSIKAGDATFMRWFSVSTRPLMPKIHAADRLTIAEAQRRMPFPIVVPKGLPAGTRLLYAHVVSEKPNPRVSLQYEAHIGSKYYDININELTGAVGPPVAHFEILRAGHATKSWNLPLRRWKHGAVVMEMFPAALPADVTERIVRANTL
ncbi:MAG TPA: hypothetical protein VN224_05290 [Xanthomonadales bacterium]|nr:hypothetical protein [Xanthomonadales bacterium]